MSFLRRKIRDPIHQQLTQGLTAEKVALTVAVGLCIAVNPIIGTTTIFCFVAAWALRLNQPIIQAINWSSYALQLLLIFPFIRLGEWMFRASPERRPLSRLLEMLRSNFAGAALELKTTLLHAFVAWLAISPLLLAALYFGTLPILRRLSTRLTAAPDPNDSGRMA